MPDCAEMFRLDISLREASRFFHAAGQFKGSVARIASHHHLQLELVIFIEFGMNRNQVDPRRHHFLEIFQHMRPGKRFAFDQFIEKLRLISGGAILGLVKKILGLLPGSVALRNLSAVARRSGMIDAGPQTSP